MTERKQQSTEKAVEALKHACDTNQPTVTVNNKLDDLIKAQRVEAGVPSKKTK